MNQKLSLNSQALFWTVLAIVLLGIVALFNNILLPFVVGAIIAYLLNPLVRILGIKGMKRWLAALVILGIFILAVAGILAIVIPLLIKEIGEFATHLPEYIERIKAFAQARLSIIEQKTGFDVVSGMQNGIQENITKALQVSQQVVGNVAAGLLVGGSAIIGFVTNALLIPIVAFFMMKDWPRITGFVHNLIPKAHKSTINGLLDQMDTKIAGFIRGQLSVCLILGAIYAIALSIAGLQYGALIGIGTGLLSIIPFVGSTIGLITSLGVAALQSHGDISYIAIIASIFFAGQFIEGNFIAPKLIGDSVGLHPLWIIFALMAGGSLVGLTGMLMAVPMAAIISVLVGFALRQYKNSDFYKTPEAAPTIITDASEATKIEITITER